MFAYAARLWDGCITIIWVCHGTCALEAAFGSWGCARLGFAGQLGVPRLWRCERARLACGRYRVVAGRMHPRHALRVCSVDSFLVAPFSPCSAWRMYSMCLHQCVPSGEWPIGFLLSLCDRECAPVTPCKWVS